MSLPAGTARIDPDDLRRLKAVGTETRVAAGQLLTERGQPGTGLYVILEGSVVVEAPERVCELGPGSCIGERALLSPDGKRTARVRAWTDVRVVAVERPQFERLCAEDPDLGDRLAATNA